MMLRRRQGLANAAGQVIERTLNVLSAPADVKSGERKAHSLKAELWSNILVNVRNPKDSTCEARRFQADVFF